MTMFKPTISLKQLSVFKNNNCVFNCEFHLGVNIVHGHNSSGKTTILDFIAYTLGAENIPWKQEALLCDTAIAEILLNGRHITVRRDVNQKLMNPMYIFWGTLSEAMVAPVTAWEIFPFKRSANKISFTQAILLALELTEAQGDGASNLTMHQFLRVMYADQPSLHSPIFRVDTFDNALTRETVGNYLCGIFDDTLYSSQLEKRELDKEIQRLTTELRSIFSVLGRSQQDVSLEFFAQKIKTMENERDSLVAELTRLKSERTLQININPALKNEDLRKSLDHAKRVLFDEEDRLARTEYEIADSLKFIEEIQSRLISIEESSVTRNYFNSLQFSFCPCCLAAVHASPADSAACSLCKNPLDDMPRDGQALRMKNELRIQLQESQALIADREADALEIRTKLPGLKQNLKQLEQKYAASTKIWSSELEDALERVAHAIGSVEQEIKGLYDSQRLSLVIQELQAKRKTFTDRLEDINATIERLEFTQVERQRKVELEVTSTLGKLLRKDLYRQKEFQRAENIKFSFSDNSISVDGANQFSESSTVVLRHLFHVALLSASTRVPGMRFPRFLMLDGIEDGGMELVRAHLLQEIIVEECETYECDYQLIIASSQIAPSLDVEAFVVGRMFSEEKRSLEIL